MRAAALGALLVIAKTLGAAGQGVVFSWWALVALFWHDIAVALVFWLIDRAFRRPPVLWLPYAAIVLWAAVNVISMRALASPLTVAMLVAAGGALADSVWHYITPANVLRVAVVVLTGIAGAVAVTWRAAGPAFSVRRHDRVEIAAVVSALVIVTLGPLAMRRADVRGLQRNAVTALVATSFARVSARSALVDWRMSPWPLSKPPDRQGESPPGAAFLNGLRGAGARRNVVVIVLESTASRYLRRYGAADDPTPRLTAFTGRALQFEQAYAVYPESIKGLFSTLCSRAPAFDVPAERHAKAACASLPRRLAGRGYRTALFHSGRFGYLGMDAIVTGQGFDVAEDAGDIGGVRESSFGVDEASTVRRLLAWVDALPRSGPFFAMYLPIAGHHPYAASLPGPFGGAGDLPAYKNALYEGDTSLGDLFDGIRARGLEGNTVFVIYGDHGEAFGQHGGNYAHSLYLYDENVRVPLWFVVPGVTKEEVRVSRVASLVDVAPTLLDILGIDPGAGDGRSLLTDEPRVALFYTDYSSPWLGLQDGCIKYLHDMDRDAGHLFDTCLDPREAEDLSFARQAQAEVYRRHVRGWAAATRSAILSGR